MTEEIQKLREKPHWSFSSLNGFINICSLQWAFKYYYKIEEEEGKPVNLLFGSAFHKTASWLAIMRMKDIYPAEKESMDIFSEMWQLECNAEENLSINIDEQNLINAKGRDMIECLSKHWMEDNVLAVAKAFSVMLPGTLKFLIGEIDLIIRDENNKHVLIDWKTSSQKWPYGKADKDLQATCFMYAYEQIEPEYVASDNIFRYDVITKTKTPVYTQNITRRNKNDFIRLAQMVKTAEKAIINEIFLPNETSFYCSSCLFKSACKSWHIKQATTIFPAIAA